MIVVYTCILGYWDNLRAPTVVDPAARYVCFTDQVMKPVPPWEFQPAYCPFQQASRNSRLPKILPHLHFEADFSIWVDGNFRLKKPPGYLIDRYLGAGPGRDLVAFKHPARNNVGAEVALLLREKIGEPSDIAAQLMRWQALEEPGGLWCGGFLIRRHTPAVADFNVRWWHEYRRGSTRDQLSFPLARHLANVPVTTIDGDIYNNDLLEFHYHTEWKTKGDNAALALLTEPYRERRRQLVEVTSW